MKLETTIHFYSCVVNTIKVNDTLKTDRLKKMSYKNKTKLSTAILRYTAAQIRHGFDLRPKMLWKFDNHNFFFIYKYIQYLYFCTILLRIKKKDKTFLCSLYEKIIIIILIIRR